MQGRTAGYWRGFGLAPGPRRPRPPLPKRVRGQLASVERAVRTGFSVARSQEREGSGALLFGVVRSEAEAGGRACHAMYQTAQVNDLSPSRRSPPCCSPWSGRGRHHILGHLHQRMQRSIHSLGIGKDGRDFRVKDNHIRTSPHAVVVLTTLQPLEVGALVFRAKLIECRLSLLHKYAFQTGSQAWRL